MKILQIIPADPRWKAVYKDEEDNNKVIRSTVACWALTEEDGDGETRVVRGMDGENEKWLDFCDDVTNFKCFEFIDD